MRRLNFGDLSAAPLIAELRDCTRAAIDLDADHVEARALSALVLHWTAALPEAELQFRDVLRAAPNHTSARLGLAWLLLAQGRFEETLTELDAASSFDPMSMNVLFNRAHVLALARRHDAARALFETGMRAGGESLFSLMACASNEMWAGDLDAADALFRRAGRLLPDNASPQYGLAYVAALRGDHQRARTLGRAARKSCAEGMHTCEAELSAYLQDRAAALSALRLTIATVETGRVLLGVNCAFEWLADDPDFLALLGAIGLTQWCGARRAA